MEKNNKRLTIIVASLLVVIGISFAYFMASLLIEGEGVRTKVTTARISGATLHVEGTIDMEDTNMMPGHKAVSAISVTATGNNQLIAYNLIWTGTNGISQINYKVYKSGTPLTPKPTTSCTPTTKVEEGVQQLSETCTISNFDSIGEPIASGSINKGDTKVVLVDGEFITAISGNGQSVYYYVVLEYPNLEIDQSGDIGASITGEVSVEESNKKADINILAVYLQDEDTKYNETSDIPKRGEGYMFSRAECSNEATATWDNLNWNITIDNLTKSGTSCNLYFDKQARKTSDQVLASLGVSSSETSNGQFTSAETGSGGVYSISDGDGISYFWRGAVTNNYVVFANKCWRIVRINGDGSIRLIFDSSTTTCKANGQGENAIDSQVYNSVSNDNAYVGYMKGLDNTGNSKSYAAAHTNTYNSSIKTYLDGWYTSNINRAISGGNGVKYSDYIDEDAGFCNDRTIASGTWEGYNNYGYGTNKTVYALVERVQNTSWDALSPHKPTLDCSNKNRDLFTVESSNKGNKKLTRPVGLITMDEVVFAGGYWQALNSSFYLYNAKKYWTMTPYWCDGNARVCFMSSNGGLSVYMANDKDPGVRPVINLKSTTAFTGNGTQTNPYEVVYN